MSVVFFRHFVFKTEIWESENSKTGIKNWISLSRPRGGDNHGGVACIYRQSDQYMLQRKSDLEMDNLETICVEVKTEINETYLLVVVYIPPSKVEQMTLLGKLVKKASLNLNLNSLLVKRQVDNPSPGAVTGGN